MMNSTTFELDNYFEVWGKQVDKDTSNISISERLKRRLPYGKRYGKMIITEICGVIASIAFLFYFIDKRDLFLSEEAPLIGFVGTIATVIIAMADCAMMLFFILKASSYENTTLQMINNQRRLLKAECTELLSIPMIILPLTLYFLMPTLFWIVNSNNIYADVQSNLDIIITIILISILLISIFAIRIYKTSVRTINECIAELKVEIVD